MPIKKIVPLLLISSFLLYSSCIISDKTLGHDLVSNDYLLKIDTVKFDIPVRNLKPDRTQGYSSSYMVFGNIYDSTFGTTAVSTAAKVYPVSDTTDFGTNPRLINAYLQLTIDSTSFFLDNQEGLAQNVYIYKLLSDLDTTKSYNNSLTAADYDPNPVSIGSPVYFGGDSLKIYLKQSYAQELLNTTPEEFDSLALFQKRIKGLYLTTDSPEKLSEGGRLNYLSLSNYSYIYLNFTMNDASRNISELDTSETFVFGYGSALNVTTSGSGKLENPAPQEKLYVEGLSGIKPNISALELRHLLDDWMKVNGLKKENVLLSRAALEFPYEMPSDYKVIDNQYPTLLYPHTVNHSDTLKFFYPLDEIYYRGNIGTIVRSLNTYAMDITSYIQSLIKKDINKIDSSLDLWISPYYLYTDSSNNSIYAFDNYNYSRAVINGPTALRKPTLTLTYSILNYNN